MSTATATPSLDAKLGKNPGKLGILAFALVLVVGVVYSGYHLLSEIGRAHV